VHPYFAAKLSDYSIFAFSASVLYIMCGIAGYFTKDANLGVERFAELAAGALSKRGPDFQQFEKLSENVGFVHTRLSIIDTSAAANQPMHDKSGRYAMIFNGEIFNFRELRQRFLAEVKFTTHSDSEVLLQMYIAFGKDCLQHLNGFFAFAIFDKQTGETFLACDRYGIKPLHFYKDEKLLLFASELKAILQFPIKKELDYNTLALYLQLNYIPGGNGILKNTWRLKPGNYAVIDSTGNLNTATYYSIPFTPGTKISEQGISYEAAKNELKKLVEAAVERRLVSDVPLGTFLSGGIDSSIITAGAAKRVSHLNTFSIGYKDEPYFDETKYANMVAKKYNTEHTVFPVSTGEMFENIFSVLDYIDEPFADSSAIAVYMLSKKTKQKVTVALSGDGGDELFAGYNKHRAEWNARKNNLLNPLLKAGLPIFNSLPQSRHSQMGNLFRQVQRYSEGLQLTTAERYWRWCTFNSQSNALKLLKHKGLVNQNEVDAQKNAVLNNITESGDINDILYADMQLVLPYDMLTKVDLMSMANSLEVRVPLLDYTVVNYAFSLPATFKVSGNGGKKILKDAFRDDLPAELFNRPKQGFEVPLLKWIRTGLRSTIENDLLEENFIKAQDIFDYAEVDKLKRKVFSNDPGDTHAIIWGLVVFQYWYKKYFAANA
jgi:asparagine synthase (glutamine-hydrolysing)